VKKESAPAFQSWMAAVTCDVAANVAFAIAAILVDDHGVEEGLERREKLESRTPPEKLRTRLEEMVCWK